jgi:hypothetical protein
VGTFTIRETPLAADDRERHPFRTFGLMLLAIQTLVIVVALLARHYFPPS